MFSFLLWCSTVFKQCVVDCWSWKPDTKNTKDSLFSHRDINLDVYSLKSEQPALMSNFQEVFVSGILHHQLDFFSLPYSGLQAKKSKKQVLTWNFGLLAGSCFTGKFFIQWSCDKWLRKLQVWEKVTTSSVKTILLKEKCLWSMSTVYMTRWWKIIVNNAWWWLLKA